MDNKAKNCTKAMLLADAWPLADGCRKMLRAAAAEIKKALQRMCGDKSYQGRENLIRQIQNFGLDVKWQGGGYLAYWDKEKDLTDVIAGHLHGVLFDWLVKRKLKGTDNEEARHEVVNAYHAKEKYMNELRDSLRTKGNDNQAWKRVADVLRDECALKSFAPKDQTNPNPCAWHSRGYTFSFEGEGLPVFTTELLEACKEDLAEYSSFPTTKELLPGEEGIGGKAIIHLGRLFSDCVRDCLGKPHAICLDAFLRFMRDRYPVIFGQAQYDSLDQSLDTDQDGESGLTLGDTIPSSFTSNFLVDPGQYKAIEMMAQFYVGRWTAEERLIFHEFYKETPYSRIKDRLGHSASSHIPKKIKRLLMDVRNQVDRHPLAGYAETDEALVEAFLYVTAQACQSRL
jgi:hypothetical protein